MAAEKPAWDDLMLQKANTIWGKFNNYMRDKASQCDATLCQEICNIVATNDNVSIPNKDYIERLNRVLFLILRAQPELEELKKYREEALGLQAILDSK